MGSVYESVIRPVLFRGDAELAHERAIGWLKMMGRFGPAIRMMEHYNRPRHGEPIELFGLSFPNAVGLAAGFDKNALCWNVMGAFGFGHVEIGTVTRHDQPGNQRPRLSRIPEHEALINRMGFPNDGAEAIAKRLAKRAGSKRRGIPIGINIGKSKPTPLDQATPEYIETFNILADFADYFAINVSSPNTPELRRLQEADFLRQLLGELNKTNAERARKLGKERIPMLVKIAPDLSFREIDSILEVVQDVGFDGIIATNTMIERPVDLGGKDEAGGLSGKPIIQRSSQIIRYMHLATKGKLPIIGVGGVTDAKSAGQLFDSGASLVQLYTGMVYRGPFFAKDIAQALVWRSAEWV
ncbi:quinone-dependent dihydroorotate dehydrogenase [Rubellicoccus peritrichatus]|uniref:Dihydroorotate dehydrogenase (quinone) n=1 Tax=Rubellicoccus peritrichatus TaxID=3080537 RepID=A0AAQ3L5U9_9BACT|nr:quinone-dependent dihydroorotate dehydrogenase [Puniceicoccus sp. CR14]WOO40004.1 quinone-dependent dihydroorotate dehydrogenase [Puniceicoccus sp. CR14]